MLTKRYLHAFGQSELEDLIAKNGFKIVKSFYSQKGQLSNKKEGYNLCLIAQKVLWC